MMVETITVSLDLESIMLPYEFHQETLRFTNLQSQTHLFSSTPKAPHPEATRAHVPKHRIPKDHVLQSTTKSIEDLHFHNYFDSVEFHLGLFQNVGIQFSRE